MWPIPVGRIAFLNPNSSDSPRRWTVSPKTSVNRSTAASRSLTTTVSSTMSPSMAPPYGVGGDHTVESGASTAELRGGPHDDAEALGPVGAARRLHARRARRARARGRAARVHRRVVARGGRRGLLRAARRRRPRDAPARRHRDRERLHPRPGDARPLGGGDRRDRARPVLPRHRLGLPAPRPGVGRRRPRPPPPPPGPDGARPPPGAPGRARRLSRADVAGGRPSPVPTRPPAPVP